MRTETKTLALLWLGLFCLFLCTAHGNLESTDSGITMHSARALWLRGDSGMRLGPEAEPLDEALIARVIADSGGRAYGKIGKDGAHAYAWFPIGHVWLMVPCVAAGEAIARLFPAIERRYRDLTAPGVEDADLPMAASYRDGHYVFDHALVSMTLPAAFGATSVLLLYLLARALSASTRDSLISALAIAFGTQFFPLARETLSDGPGLAFLLGALASAIAHAEGMAGRATLLAGGALCGAAVLTRYAHGLLAPFLLLEVALAARRRGRIRDAFFFAAGGVPFAILLAAVDHSRFGNAADTGYPPFSSWFQVTPWIGVPKLLIAGGKGILWFSPLLWLGLPFLVRSRGIRHLRFARIAFLGLLVLFGSTQGWQSGQCWGARYVTPGIVILLGIALPQALPWARRRRAFLALASLGVFVNLTSVLAPTHGHNQLAAQALEAHYRGELEAGRITEEDLRAVLADPADRYFFEWRYSPLHANWTYAWLSWTGRFGDDQLAPKRSVADTIEPLFGVTSADEAFGLAPTRWEDRGFRHLWFVFWGALLRVPPWSLLLPVLAAAGVSLAVSVRRLSRNRSSP
ncbi:MAG: hypothetical protein Fur0037_05880 [Planctomycetota bacterium]